MAKIDEQISYNWLFFLLAGAFGAVTFWAVFDETATRREYKGYQEAFFEIESKLAEKNLEAARKTRDANPEYKKLVDEKKRLEEELAGGKKGQLAEAKAKLQAAEFEAFDKQQNYTFTKSNLDETYYFFTVAKHDDPEGKSAEYKAREKQLKSYEEALKKDEAAMLATGKARDDAKAAVSAFTARIVELEKQIGKIDTEFADAERKYAAAVKKKSGLFGPDTEILQQNLEAIGRVDRCESCHVGSNKGGFEKIAEKHFRSHPYRRTLFAIHPVEKFGCTTCHDGQGRATTKFYAHAPSESIHDFETHFWEEPLLKGAMMESNCRKCHKEEVELRAELRCETTDECPGKMKCEVPAQPVNPNDTNVAIEGLWPPKEPVPGAPVVDVAKYCVNPENNIAELVDLAPHLTRGRKIIEEVGCFGCHPIEGYEKLGKPAPDLRHAASKLNPGWVVEWIRNPKAFHKNTRMPNFFPEELHPEEYPKSALPTREDRSKNPNEPWKWTTNEQLSALTSFLLSQSTPFNVPAKLPVAGDAARGKKLVLDLGCRGCHNLSEDEKDPTHINYKNRGSHYDHGPALNNIGSKTSAEWIFAWVKDPKAFAPDTRMPNLRLSDQEAADIAVYLSGNKDKREFPAVATVDASDKELVAGGKKLLNYYGCYGCHYVNGFENTAGIGVELTEFGIKDVARLDFGDYIVNHKKQNWSAWLRNKLEHPRVYRYDRVDTRMPQFDFTPEEIEDVMVVLKGMRGKQLDSEVASHKLTAMERAREDGRGLVRWYNCYGCHTVDGHVGDIRQAAEYAGDKASYAPPLLAGEGAKTQPAWLFGFFKNVEKLRPWLNVRMPTFGFDDKHATTLVQMFSAMDHAPYPYPYYGDMNIDPAKKRIGQELFNNLKCLSCHVVGDQKLSEEEAARAAPNLLMAKRRLRPEWIAKWLANPEALQMGTRMPAFWSGGANMLEGLLSTPAGQVFKSFVGIDEVKISSRAQIEAVRDHVFTLELGGSAKAPSSSGKKKAAAPTGANRVRLSP